MEGSRVTRTYVLLEVGDEAYEDIKNRIKNIGGYDDLFGPAGEIHMDAIAIVKSGACANRPKIKITNVQVDLPHINGALELLERGLDEICQYAFNTSLEKSKMRRLIRQTCNAMDHGIRSFLKPKGMGDETPPKRNEEVPR